MSTFDKKLLVVGSLSFVGGILASSLVWWQLSTTTEQEVRALAPHWMALQDWKRKMEETLQRVKTLEDLKELLRDVSGDISSRIGELPGLSKRRRWPWDRRRPRRERQTSTLSPASSRTTAEENMKSDLCIGSIFGLDVGGTLAKLVYFEQNGISNGSSRSSTKHKHSRSVLHLADIRDVSSSYDDRCGDEKSLRHSIVEGVRKSQDDLDSNVERRDSFLRDLKINAESASPRPSLSRHNSVKSTESMPRSRSLLNLKQDRVEALENFYDFARRLDSYREGIRDDKLSFSSRDLQGKFHFIHFETRRMPQAMDLIRANQLHLNIQEMGATGGGAHKYAPVWETELGIEIQKHGELDSLVRGMQFVLSTVVGECYTFRPSHVKHASSTSTILSDESCHSEVSEANEHDDDSTERITSWSRKVRRDAISYASTYPYLVVTIGTGVSILRVDGPQKFERISGSTIGGGTYWGLIRLLTDVENFDGVMKLAARGDPCKVDMMVGDIYGENSDALKKLGLPADVVASSFGKLVAKDDPASGLKQEDLARALLLMITNNIGQVAYLNAKLAKTSRIYFVGNFLRRNVISQTRLSYAIDYWSKGEMEALFLEHEGYFGALGAFLLNQKDPVK